MVKSIGLLLAAVALQTALNVALPFRDAEESRLLQRRSPKKLNPSTTKTPLKLPPKLSTYKPPRVPTRRAPTTKPSTQPRRRPDNRPMTHGNNQPRTPSAFNTYRPGTPKTNRPSGLQAPPKVPDGGAFQPLQIPQIMEMQQRAVPARRSLLDLRDGLEERYGANEELDAREWMDWDELN